MFWTVCWVAIFTYFLRNFYVICTYFEGTRGNAGNRREIAKKRRKIYVIFGQFCIAAKGCNFHQIPLDIPCFIGIYGYFPTKTIILRSGYPKTDMLRVYHAFLRPVQGTTAFAAILLPPVGGKLCRQCPWEREGKQLLPNWVPGNGAVQS